MKIDFSAKIRDLDPIETKYRGYWFRSRLEARWAVFFQHIGLEWTYEIQGFRLRGDNGDEILYLPDFYIQDIRSPWEKSTRLWVEVKGVMKKKSKEKCQRLAIESETPVIILQGDPVEPVILIYRKHTPKQRVYFDTIRDEVALVKRRSDTQAQLLQDAREKARSKRF